MNRRAFLGALGLLAAPPASEAQQTGKIYRLGTLNLGARPSAGTYDARRDVVEALRELGYIEGRNLEVVRRYADGHVERLPALATELVPRKPRDGWRPRGYRISGAASVRRRSGP